MMKLTSSHLISNGEAQPQSKGSGGHGNAKKTSHKKTKKPMKSNISNKPKSKKQTSRMDVDGESDEEDGDDSSSVGETTNDAAEPDVSTLSGVTPLGVGEDTPRLTGTQTVVHDMFDDMIDLNDSSQALGGAGHDLNDSEDDYGGVEDVSGSDVDDDDDEDDIIRSAEKDLIEEFERIQQRRDTNVIEFELGDLELRRDDNDDAFARILMEANGIDAIGPPVDMAEDPFLGLSRNDHAYNTLWNEAEDALWRMPESVRRREGSDSNSNQKRVRFEEREMSQSASSSSDSEDDPNDAFPDLFTASDNAAIKQQLAIGAGLEQEFDFPNADAESFYDFEDEDERFAFQVDEQSDSDSDASTYDSDDEGDTTDEESLEEALAKLQERKRAAGKLGNSPPSTPIMANRAISTTTTPANSRPTTPRNCRGPRTGTFAIDPTRAVMTTDKAGKNLRLIPPSQPTDKERAFWERAKTATSSRTSTPPNSAYLTMPSPVAMDDAPPRRPLTVKSTLGSMFNGDVDLLRAHDISGIAEDMFPHILATHQQSPYTTTNTDESEIESQEINMEDFLASDPSDSEPDILSPPPSSSSAAAARDGSLTPGLLDRFDQRPGIVASFRRNQVSAKHFSSLASHPGKRASTHEFNALQKGKRGAANTPMTPARKKRVSRDFAGAGNLQGFGANGVRKNVGSPAQGRRPRSRGNSLGGNAAGLFQTLGRNPFDG